MAERGITKDGFIDPAFIDLYTEVRQDWFERTGRILRERRADDDLFRTMLERLSTKGLDDEDERELAYWQSLRQAFLFSSVDFAEGIALDLLVPYRDLERSAAQKAKGVIVFTGASGTNIPSGTRVAKGSDASVELETDRVATIGDSGDVAVPVTAVTAGIGANSGVNTFTVLPTPVSGVTSVTNNNATEEIAPGGTPDSWDSLDNDGSDSNYQVLDISDFLYPVGLKKITVELKNPSGDTQVYALQWFFYDDADGSLIEKSAVFTLSLDGLEQRAIEFDNLFVDLGGFASVRAALVNHKISDGAVEVGIQNVGTGGQWYLNGVLQSADDLFATWNTEISGVISGGRDSQTDEELVERYHQVQFNAAGGTPNGLYSKLFMLPAVRGVRIYLNNATESRSVGSGLTLPAKSFAAVVDGGDPDDIAEKISTSGAGLLSVGDVTRSVTLDGGNVEPISFYYAARRPVFVKVRLSRKASFPAKGNTLVKDEIIKLIGGFDSKDTMHLGLSIGESVSHAHVVDALLNVTGIKFADVRLGDSFSAAVEDDFDILALERPWCKPEQIEVI